MTRRRVRRFTRSVARRADDGVGMIVAVMFVAVAGVLSSTVALVAVHGNQNAGRDKDASHALQTADAGVAQAVQLLRTTSSGYFNCFENASTNPSTLSAACSSNPAGWTSSASPEKVRSDGAHYPDSSGTWTSTLCDGSTLPCFAVWISTLQQYTPYSASVPNSGFAVYRVHSTGLAGGGPGARSVVVDLKVKPAKFPIGVYADSVTTGGTFGVNHESMFSKGCINHREGDTYSTDNTATSSGTVPASSGGGGGITFSGIDPQYDQPAAAHAVGQVTQANSGCSTGTSSSVNNANVHDPSYFGKCNAPGSGYPRNMPNYFDQDSQGADLTGTPCYGIWTDPATGKRYPTTSEFTMADLQQVGYRPGGLSPGEYADLESLAQSMNTYTTDKNFNPLSALTAASVNNAVVYYDLSGGTVTLTPSMLPSSYFRALSDNSACTTTGSVVIVVRNGNLVYNTSGNAGGGNPLVASFFVPEGSYSGQGNASVIGTLFAQSLGGTGTQNWYLDKCFVANPPGPVQNVTVINYRQVNTQNVH